uniref:Cytochrome c oxidase subunit 2 n=1 Tax=Sparassis crispa TaxID=139825 RepID=A0A6N0GSI8_9APHY|nr:Cox2 [Sparassis crispa]
MLKNILIFNTIFNDAPQPWQIGFQDSAAPGFTGIVELHNTIFFYLVVISVSVFWVLGSIIYYYNFKKSPIVHKYLNHGTLLELIWTITPAFVLIAIAFPSFRLLYLLDEVISPTITIKVVGFLKDGLKSYILNKIKDTQLGQKNIIQKLYNILGIKKLTINNNRYQNPTTLPLKKLSVYKTFHSKVIYKYNVSNISNGLYLSKHFFHSRSRAMYRIGPHNIDVISVIFGLLLGDGYASNRSGEGVRISIKQSIIHKEYLFSLYYFFFNRGYCSNLEPRKYTRTIKGIDKIYYGYEFNTYTFRSFLWIYKSFYKNGKKIVPLNTENFFTPLTLAIWISDDGGWTNDGVRISCNSFTLVEVEYLISILKNKFNLNCTIQKIYLNNKYSIYIKKDSITKLKFLILPHLDKSMFYKLGLIDNSFYPSGGQH